MYIQNLIYCKIWKKVSVFTASFAWSCCFISWHNTNGPRKWESIRQDRLGSGRVLLSDFYRPALHQVPWYEGNKTHENSFETCFSKTWSWVSELSYSPCMALWTCIFSRLGHLGVHGEFGLSSTARCHSKLALATIHQKGWCIDCRFIFPICASQIPPRTVCMLRCHWWIGSSVKVLEMKCMTLVFVEISACSGFLCKVPSCDCS